MAAKPKKHHRMTRACPSFLVDDVIATAEYYRDVLGFSFDYFFGDPPGFVIVDRDDVRLMFRQIRPTKPGTVRSNTSIMQDVSDTYIYVTDLEDLAAELRAKQADIVEQPVTRVYGMREMKVRDKNGYVLVFGQDPSTPAAS